MTTAIEDSDRLIRSNPFSRLLCHARIYAVRVESHTGSDKSWFEPKRGNTGTTVGAETEALAVVWFCNSVIPPSHDDGGASVSRTRSCIRFVSRAPPINRVVCFRLTRRRVAGAPARHRTLTRSRER